MTTITVTGGGPDIEPGVYLCVLTKVEGPKSISPQRGPNAGQTINIFDWTFEVFEGPYAGTELRGTTSAATGPRSKMYGWLTALLGGQPPVEGTQFNENDLTGRLALATIMRDEGGWPRIETLSALPAHMQAGTVFANAMGVPSQAQPAQQPPQQQQWGPGDAARQQWQAQHPQYRPPAPPTMPQQPAGATVSPLRGGSGVNVQSGPVGPSGAVTGGQGPNVPGNPADDLPF